MSEKLPDCSDQLKEYLNSACKEMGDACSIKDMPIASDEAIEFVLKSLSQFKGDKSKIEEILDKYQKDTKECKI